MKWILIFGNGINASREELVARQNFIRNVTGTNVTPWRPVLQNGQIWPLYAISCESDDDIDALFITGHVNEILHLCPLIDQEKPQIIILNTCALISKLRESILVKLQQSVPNISLYYAHQQRTLTGQYVNLSYEGNFGFQTSISERLLFQHRRKGFLKSLTFAFDHIT